MNNSKHNRTIDNWYEVRVDGEKVAAFAPISRDASTKAFKLVEDTRLDLYKGKQMQIVAIHSNPDWENEAKKHQSEEVIHEVNPIPIFDPSEKFIAGLKNLSPFATGQLADKLKKKLAI